MHRCKHGKPHLPYLLQLMLSSRVEETNPIWDPHTVAERKGIPLSRCAFKTGQWQSQKYRSGSGSRGS
jgi:hypothetical protein